MSLSVGIVGLPNSGKSTLFNTLLKRQVALVADYPFTTIEPNVGVVAVPDENLSKLKKVLKPEKAIPATVKFIDIAGLVKGAHQGEGLGNKFLSKIREVDVLVHLLRGFENERVVHYYGSLDPLRDKEMVDLELELGEIKKPALYILNGEGKEEGEKGKWDLVVNAQTGEGVDELIKAAFKLLGLITFYSVKGDKEITAWSIKKGSSALDGAGLVHTDMAKGFIKAEVVSLADLLGAGSWLGAKRQGKIRLEGRDYQIKDKDVIEFKFNL